MINNRNSHSFVYAGSFQTCCCCWCFWVFLLSSPQQRRTLEGGNLLVQDCCRLDALPVTQLTVSKHCSDDAFWICTTFQKHPPVLLTKLSRIVVCNTRGNLMHMFLILSPRLKTVTTLPCETHKSYASSLQHAHASRCSRCVLIWSSWLVVKESRCLLVHREVTLNSCTFHDYISAIVINCWNKICVFFKVA